MIATILAWIAIVLGVLGTLYVLLAAALLTAVDKGVSLTPIFIPLSVILLAILFLVFRHRLGI